MVTRDEVVAVAMSYVGTKFCHQGRRKHVGIDCVGLLVLVARELGLKSKSATQAKDFTAYGRVADGRLLKSMCDEHLIPISKPNIGDVILVSWPRHGNRPQHMGICVDATPGRMYWVHADAIRHKAVLQSRLVFGLDGMALVQAYGLPGVQ